MSTVLLRTAVATTKMSRWNVVKLFTFCRRRPMSTICLARNALSLALNEKQNPKTEKILSCFAAGLHQKRSIVNSAKRTFCQQEKERWTDLSYEQLVALLESKDIILIDVREPTEIEELGKIPHSVNIPLSQVKEALQLEPEIFDERFKCEKPQKYDPSLVFYGLCEVKSAAALEIAQKLGFKKARHFPGGFEEWSKRHSNDGGDKKFSASA